MPEQDGAVFGSPACGNDTAADSPRRRGWRAAAAALVVLGLAVLAAVSVDDSATAVPPAPIGRWVSAGAEVELDRGSPVHPSAAATRPGSATTKVPRCRSSAPTPSN